MLVERISKFNELILALARAGIPIEIDGATGGATLKSKLAVLQSSLEARIARGVLESDVVKQAEGIPQVYRLALQDWLENGESVAALDLLVGEASAARGLVSRYRLAWLQTAVQLLFLGCAIWVLSVWTLPAIISMYRQMEAPLGRFASILLFAVDYAPYWVSAAVILIVCMIGYVFYWRPGMGRIPGVSRIAGEAQVLDSTRKANAARYRAMTLLASLTRRGASSSGERPESEVSGGNELERWMATVAESPEEMAVMLNAVAKLHEFSARRCTETYRMRLNNGLTLFISAVCALVVCLALFLPFSELLTWTAEVGGTH